MVLTEKGPNRSQWINSKGLVVTWELEGKESLFCFEKWHTSQQVALFWTSISTKCFNNCSFDKERCPNLECHKSEEEVWLTLVTRVVDLDGGTKAWSKYRPLLCLPRPIMLHWARSWMKHQSPRNIRQQNLCLVSWLTEMRLKLKDGTHNTSVSVSVEEICTVPMCVTTTFSPFGK